MSSAKLSGDYISFSSSANHGTASAAHAHTRVHLDCTVANVLTLRGATDVPVKLSNVAHPSVNGDVATKGYVDALAAGLRVYTPVDYATGAAINVGNSTNAQYVVDFSAEPATIASNNSSSHTRTFNDTFNDANGMASGETVVPVVGMRILIRATSRAGPGSAFEGTNFVRKMAGIWYFTVATSGVVWTLTRAPDMSGGGEVYEGGLVTVNRGTQAGQSWGITADFLRFAQPAGTGTYLMCTGTAGSTSLTIRRDSSNYTLSVPQVESLSYSDSTYRNEDGSNVTYVRAGQGLLCGEDYVQCSADSTASSTITLTSPLRTTLADAILRFGLNLKGIDADDNSAGVSYMSADDTRYLAFTQMFAGTTYTGSSNITLPGNTITLASALTGIASVANSGNALTLKTSSAHNVVLQTNDGGANSSSLTIADNGNITLSPGGSGIVNVDSHRITGVSTPTADADAATKAYVDLIPAKPSARVATTAALANITGVWVYNSAAGTLTAAGNGTHGLIDGITLVSGNLVLIKDGFAAAVTSGVGTSDQGCQGLYEVTTLGAVGAIHVYTRVAQMNATADFSGAKIFVEEGTSNGGKTFKCTVTPNAASNPFVLNSSTAAAAVIAFSEFGAGGGASYTGTANQITLASDAFRIAEAFSKTDFTQFTATTASNGNVAVTAGGSGTMALNTGTGTLAISDSATAATVNIGTGAAAKTVTLGSIDTTSSLVLQGGTGVFTVDGSRCSDTNFTIQIRDALSSALVIKQGVNAYMTFDTTDGAELIRFGKDCTGYVFTGSAFTASSDVRLKHNIQTVEDPLDKIERMRGVTWNWIANDKQSCGVVAQELAEVLPCAVSGTASLSVNYAALTGVFIEAIKRLKTKIEELEAANKTDVEGDEGLTGKSRNMLQAEVRRLQDKQAEAEARDEARGRAVTRYGLRRRRD